jgi:hypothetical protein
MAVPHRNDVPSVAAECPDDHHHPTAEKTGRNETRLAIVKTVVGYDRMQSREHLHGIGKIQPSLSQAQGSFVGIICDFHSFCTPQ